MFDHLDQGGDTQPVIQGFTPQAGADLLKGGGEGGAVADFRLAAAGWAQVDFQAVQRDHAFTLVAGGMVNGLGADHPRDVIFAHQDRFPGQLAHIDPANQFKTKQAFISAFHQHEADFIHVGIQHHFQRRLLPGVNAHQHAAHGIDFHLIGVRGNFFQNDPAYFALIT